MEALFNRSGSTEKLAVRAKPRQPEGIGIRLSIDRQQVGLDVAFTVACPLAAQVMVAVFGCKRLLSHQRQENWLQLAIERSPVLPFGLANIPIRAKPTTRNVTANASCDNWPSVPTRWG